MEGVPHYNIDRNKALSGDMRVVDMLTSPYSNVFPSKSEYRKVTTAGGLSINKTKLMDSNAVVTAGMLINDRHIVVQKGKKNYYLFTLE